MKEKREGKNDVDDQASAPGDSKVLKLSSGTNDIIYCFKSLIVLACARSC